MLELLQYTCRLLLHAEQHASLPQLPLQLIYQTLFGTIIVNMPPMHTIIHVVACALSFG